ncbi:MAG: hypothetical protein U1F42_09605 [Candidatus Competibacteraceae bacterium]
MTQNAQNSILSSLRSASSADLKRIVKDYQDQRQSDVQELISIISEQEETLRKTQKIETNTREWFAITLLGDTRSATAVPILIRLIALRDSSFSLISNESNPHWYSFPAAVALSKIGMPAVEHLLELAHTAPPTSTAFHLASITLEAILGEELTLSAVEQYARRYPDFSQKDRFSILTTLLRTGHKHWNASNAADCSPE